MRIECEKKTEDIEIAPCLDLSQGLLKILASRGITGEENIKKFLSPSEKDMLNPFSIDGMKEAVDRLNLAAYRNESILIFGDYDCDGICATTILYETLKGKVSSLHYFVPDRNNDGYGMSVAVLEKILSEYEVNLIVTVDCGITSVNEIEFLKARNVDVIVTDHHEPQDEIPDCIIVNPKLKRTTFSEFCGAGVALKLSEALTSRKEALKFVDVAAIATIADIVPLVDENRIIAKLGIEKMKKSPLLAIKQLVSENVNAYEIMYKVAPRINAAGRMDTAMKAVEMFLSDDYFIIKKIADELSQNNVERQKKCDEVVVDCERMLKSTRFDDLNFIVLSSEKWEAGILGIAASRLVEKYNRPTLLFAEKDGKLKGSCRSISCINVFEVLKKFDSHYLSFGGHSLAAGLAIDKEEFETVKKLLNRELSHLDKSVFFDKVRYDLELDLSEPLLDFAKELEKLEPTGYGNPKPVFKVNATDLKFERLGRTDHIKAKSGKNEIIGFFKYDERFMAECDSTLIVNLNKSVFQNDVTAQLVIKDVYVENVNLSDEKLSIAALDGLASYSENHVADLKTIELNAETFSDKFGTLFVAYTKDSFERIEKTIDKNHDMPVGIGVKATSSPQNQIVICPNKSFDFSAFNKVIFFEKPVGGFPCDAMQDCFYSVVEIKNQTLPTVEREELLKVFALLKSKDGTKPNSRLKAEIMQKTGLSEFKFFAAMQIFEELTLISFDEKGIINVSNKKTSLENSPTYRAIKEINV